MELSSIRPLPTSPLALWSWPLQGWPLNWFLLRYAVSELILSGWIVAMHLFGFWAGLWAIRGALYLNVHAAIQFLAVLALGMKVAKTRPSLASAEEPV